jgi:SAM-dependent methyltransferase
MLEDILSQMRCPACLSTHLECSSSMVACAACGRRYPFRDGILDFLGDEAAEVITPFQRIMQSPLVVSIYERFWRRLGYFIASSRTFEKEVATILRLQRPQPTGRLLDLACGPGVFTRPLARQAGGAVVGLDLSWPMLHQARRLAQREGLSNVVLMRGTAFRLPFVDGAFQHVNCCGALHLFDQPDLALSEIVRVLDPAGGVSVQTTIRPIHSGGMAFFLERFIRFGFFDEQDLIRRLELQGLHILESERHRISYSFLAARQPRPATQ